MTDSETSDLADDALPDHTWPEHDWPVLEPGWVWLVGAGPGDSGLLTLHGGGKEALLLIDEAQLLSPEALEQLRLLTNLETRERKLLQVILVGQPELRDTLARAELRQLAQRITARYHLEALGPEMLKAMLCHRLAVAGALTQPFSAAAFRELHRQSGGIPRIANLIADRALLAGYGAGEAVVDGAQVKGAAREVRGNDKRSRRSGRGVALAALLLLSAAALWLALQAQDDPDAAPAPRLGSTKRARWASCTAASATSSAAAAAISSGSCRLTLPSGSSGS